MALPELDPSLYKRKIEGSQETVYEIFAGNGWGLAFADIKQSERHYHNETREHYVVVEGRLEVNFCGEAHLLLAGQQITIPPGVPHSARSLDKDPTRVAVFSWPAWKSEDHHLLTE